MSKVLTLLSDPNLSEEEIGRIVALRNHYEAVSEQIRELCSEGPERTVALRFLEESLSCAIRCILPETNPFTKNDMTQRAKFMKKNPGRWQKKMKDAGLSAPYQSSQQH